MAATARSASTPRTAKQIVCSEDACEIRITLTRDPASVRNRRSAMPGTPTIPGPESVSSDSCPTVVMPLASVSPGSLFAPEIKVPGADGLNVFLIRIGMRLATAGAIVAEWMTLAPKSDSSIASSYVIVGSTNAEGTSFGSALSTPSTSVQISTDEAPTAAPMIDAL